MMSRFILTKEQLVEDSLIVLQELAKFHRKHLKLPIIALTVVMGNNH
jgi:UDP-N-acetylmuramoyl-tripeptide--D-alanyl-D-alanine ligase